MKDIDYLPDEMAKAADYYGVNRQISEFYLGWRAACEAMQAKAHPQPAPDWRAACKIGKIPGGCVSLQSPTGEYWIGRDGKSWTRNGHNYVYQSEASARAALAVCPVAPPDAAEAARAT